MAPEGGLMSPEGVVMSSEGVVVSHSLTPSRRNGWWPTLVIFCFAELYKNPLYFLMLSKMSDIGFLY